MSGFTYNGIHSSKFNVEYIPDASDKWFEGADYDVYDTDVAWRNGGYYYGNRAKKRTMTIKCFYEMITIAQREQIRKWLGRNTRGMLILDDMPFVQWDVVPTKLVQGKRYLDTDETYSGTFSFVVTAYNSFGYLTRLSNDGTENDHAEDYCGLINTSEMPAAPTSSSRDFDIYNPGTESCGLSISMVGSTSYPIRFLNTSNNTSCIFSSLPDNGLELMIDGETGFVQVNVQGSTSYDNGYAYHDKGVVRLDPNMAIRDTPYVYNGLNGTLSRIELIGEAVKENMINATVQIGDLPCLVESISEENNELLCSISGSGTIPASGTCTLFTVNHIQIQEMNESEEWVSPTTLSLSALSVEYIPKLL